MGVSRCFIIGLAKAEVESQEQKRKDEDRFHDRWILVLLIIQSYLDREALRIGTGQESNRGLTLKYLRLNEKAPTGRTNRGDVVSNVCSNVMYA